jgi:GNAT superfamily N-acetyltransferase
MIKGVMHDDWPPRARVEAMDDAAAERWIVQWIAEGCDDGRDIVLAVRDLYVMPPFGGPPVGFRDLDAAVARNRARGAAIAAARPLQCLRNRSAN